MAPFALLARRGCSTPCGLSLALAAEFAPVRAGRVDLALEELSAWLVGARPDDPEAQLAAVASWQASSARPSRCPARSTTCSSIASRSAAPGTRCCWPSPASRRRRRAGLPLGIVAGPDGAFLAHRELAEPLLVDPAEGRLRDARTLAEPVAWQCCHQVAARILNRIGERAERVGHVVWALRAAELRLALPFDEPTRERLQHDLRRVRARLN
jgi:hypothetical protein